MASFASHAELEGQSLPKLLKMAICPATVALRSESGRNFFFNLTQLNILEYIYSRLLVPPDLSKSNRARPVAMRLLHPTSGGGRLPSSFGGKLFPGCFSTSGFTGSLLGA